MRRTGKTTATVVIAAMGIAALRGRFRRYEIAEQSMLPALRPGDYIVAVLSRELLRGDIVIFDYPDRVGFELVKRVVGLPGDRVAIANGRVHINGVVLAESWANGPTLPNGEWPLRRDEVFVLGDNRAVSGGDSRTVGPIAVDTIGWRVVARYWPPSGLAWIVGMGRRNRSIV